MNHIAYNLAVIRRDQLLREAAERRLAAECASPVARVAGLRLRHRAADWHGEPFTRSSWRHVSVYEPANSGGGE
jgi:hypothetical protein